MKALITCSPRISTDTTCTHLEILGERFVELLVVVLVLGDVVEQLQTLLDEVLADHLQDLTLLQHLSRDVQRQILRVDDASHEAQVLGDQLLAVVHDEDATHVQLDVVALLLVLEHVERGSLRHVEQRAELQLTLHREVLQATQVDRQTMVQTNKQQHLTK